MQEEFSEENVTYSTVSYVETLQLWQHKLYYEFQTGLFLPKHL